MVSKNSSKKQDKKIDKAAAMKAEPQIALVVQPEPVAQSAPKLLRTAGGADAVMMAAFLAATDGGNVDLAIVEALGKVDPRFHRAAIDKAIAACPSERVRMALNSARVALPEAKPRGARGVSTVRQLKSGLPYCCVTLPRDDARFPKGGQFKITLLQDGSIVLNPIK